MTTTFESAVMAKLQIIEDKIAAIGARPAGGAAPAPGARGELAPFTEQEIAAFKEWGDPQLKFSPQRNWPFEDVSGRYMSQLAPNVLRALAANLADYALFCDRDGRVDNKGRPKGNYPWNDARKALYWADKIETKAAWKPAAPPPPAQAGSDDFQDFGDDNVPF